MTTSSPIRGPRIPAPLLFRRVAPTCAQELSRQLYRAGIGNSNDLIMGMTTGLSHFARENGVCLATDFPEIWPEALRALKESRSEAEWECFLHQSATAPQVPTRQMLRGAAQMLKVLEATSEAVQMSPRAATALGTWIITAVVIAHSGPLDADLCLEDLAEYF